MANKSVSDSAAPNAVATARVSLRYFSGTGNTFRVASWIAQTARARGAEVDMVPISTGRGHGRPPVVVLGPCLLGVLTPTHGFTATWASLVHAATVPGVRGVDVFTTVTRAGWFMGPLRLPGFEGTAAWLLAMVLVLRGGHLVGVRAVDMPSNWTSLHWGLNEEHISAILRAANVKATDFAERILDGRSQLTGWLPLAFGLLVAPVSLLYLLLARPLLGKLFFVDERCTSCGLCAQHCPVAAVHMIGSEPRTPYWSAVQASWLAAVAQSLAMLAVFEMVAGMAAVLGGLTGNVIALVLASVAILALTEPAYRIAWLLGRLRPVAWLRGHMTPTRFFRRYREPGTDLRDI